MDKKTVLAIDDLPLELAIFRNILESRFGLLRAESAQEALRLLESNHVDLIVLDIEMPDMSGFEFLHQARQLPGLKDTPVIIVSSHSGKEFVDHALSQGANALLPKPVNPSELLKKVISLLDPAAG